MTWGVTGSGNRAARFKLARSERAPMENLCRFGQGYVPSHEPDAAALAHVRNCPDCSEAVLVVDGSAAWAVTADGR